MNNNKYATYENVLLSVLFLTFGFVFFDRLALSFLFPFMEEELQLSNSHLGLLSSVLALAWAVSGALVGAWSDRIGKRKPILIVAIILFSLCSALSGMVTGFISLLIFRAVMGLAEGPILPLSQSMMVEASSPHRRGLNMGLLQGSAAGLLGAVIGPPVIIAMAEAWGWRQAFILSLIPGLIIAFLVWKYVKPDTASQSASQTAAQPVDQSLDGSADQEEPKPRGLKAYTTLLSNRNILLCTLISCFYLTWFVVLISFTPTFLVKVRGFEPATMGSIMSCLGVAWVIWGFVVAGVSDRIGRKPTLVIFTLLAACCPMVLLYSETPMVMGALVILTYTGLGCFTLFMATIPAETVSRGQIATALGLIMGIGELIGGFVSPTLAGFAADQYGLQIVMFVSSGAAIVAAALSLLLKETAPAVLARRNQAQPVADDTETNSPAYLRNNG
ncbi:MFS transporter [Marinobacterium lutimaris]|uniref:Sugar phosphate permease n=1 Tax=Marinobacterium lutimaris TaxID=568106 RepID=A0A1H6D8S3_9GAMM|nr:MFS transporter [Marinobacterium lutimaris]SEG81524.1 Sugar phosphate permease [Marinobacterium lutimaris]